MMVTINWIDVGSKIFIGIAGLLISWQAYLQTQQREKEAWIKTFAEIHAAFWNDPIIQNVRCWLAYPRAYGTLRIILIRRQALFEKRLGTSELIKREYLMLDALDKYLNILLRVVTINPKMGRDNLLNALHFKYWLNACLDLRRPELCWYVRQYYLPLYEFGQTPEFRDAGERLGFKRLGLTAT